MEGQNYIVALREIEGRSLRDIAEHTVYHFNTVKKYADKEDWNMEYRQSSLLMPASHSLCSPLFWNF